MRACYFGTSVSGGITAALASSCEACDLEVEREGQKIPRCSAFSFLESGPVQTGRPRRGGGAGGSRGFWPVLRLGAQTPGGDTRKSLYGTPRLWCGSYGSGERTRRDRIGGAGGK